MKPHFSTLHFLAPVQGAFAIAQVKLLRENPQHPRKDDYVKPKSRNAFSFRISGRFVADGDLLETGRPTIRRN
jgi:hypothetical protein